VIGSNVDWHKLARIRLPVASIRMGQPCSVHKCMTVKEGHNSFVTGTPDYDHKHPGMTRTTSQVYLILLAMSYKQTNYSLSVKDDAHHIEDLARNYCGVRDIHTLYDEACNKDAVLSLLQDIGERCGKDDYVVIYYAGHGSIVEEDNVFCCVTKSGQIDGTSMLTDDEFAEALLHDIPEETNVLMLSDAVHSQPILDLEKDYWSDRRAIDISGSRDFDTARQHKISHFTQALLMAVEKLSTDDHYSVGKLFNTMVVENDRLFRISKQICQDLTVACTNGVAPNEMAWPLVPTRPYVAPLKKAKLKSAAAAQDYDDSGFAMGHPAMQSSSGGFKMRGIDIGDYSDVPDDLADWAKNNDIDLGDSYKDEELENGWKGGKKLLDKLGF